MKENFCIVREEGQAMIETIIVLPVILLFILIIMEVAMLYNAKQIVNYAGFCAARAGSAYGLRNRLDTLRIHRAAALALASISPQCPLVLSATFQSAFQISDELITNLPSIPEIPKQEFQRRFLEAYLRTKIDSVKINDLNIIVYLTYYYRCRVFPIGKIFGTDEFEYYINYIIPNRYPVLNGSNYLNHLFNIRRYNVPIRTAIRLDYWAGD